MLKQILKSKVDYKKTIATICVFFAYAFLFIFSYKNTYRLTDSFEFLKVGDLVARDVIAQKSVKFIDEAETEKKKKEAAAAVYSIYTRDDSKFLSTIRYLREDAQYDTKNAENYKLLELLLNDIYKQGYFEWDELNSDSKDKIEFEGRLYKKTDLLTKANIRMYIRGKYANKEDYNLTNTGDNFIFNGVMRYLVPNIVYNLFETRERQNKESESVEPVMVEVSKGDVILVKDEIVTAQKYAKLMKIRELENTHTAMVNIACLVFAFFYILFIFFLFYKFILESNSFRKDQYYYIAVLAELLFLLFSIFEFYLFALGNASYLNAWSLMCCPSILSSGITKNKKTGYTLLILNLFLFLVVPFVQWAFLLRGVASTIIAIEFLDIKRRGKDVFTNLLVVIILNAIAVVLIDIPSLSSWSYVFFDSLFEVIKILISYFVCVLVNIIFEGVFNLPSRSRLEVLANNTSALLERFKSACIGSFEHSESVADIAENAANAIGANALLVRVAARYHDVGKMEHPEYFVENQREDGSKHLVLKNKLSAAIIKSHVSLGIKLLKENHIPPEIIEIVSQHHGNDLIAYFYFEAKKEAAGAKIDESDYSYQFDPPTSKESAILMLSDISEAATRSKTDPMTEQDLKNFIHTLIQTKIQHSQLDNSTLTIGELIKIEESIVATLKGKFHKRIVYPHDEDEE